MNSSRRNREPFSETFPADRFSFEQRFGDPRDPGRFAGPDCTTSEFEEDVRTGKFEPFRFGHLIGTLELILERRTKEVLSREDSPILVRSIPINDLNDAAVEVTGSLQVEVEVYDIETIAKIPELNLWASADSESEAILEIKRSLLELWEELEREPDTKLGRLPKMWKRILAKKLKRRVETEL